MLEEHHLQQTIAREEALRTEHPDLWRQVDVARIARNQQLAELNTKLRSAGCRPVTMEPSLRQKMRRLQQLQARNNAELAISAKAR
jgi:hypothetical protein